MIEIFLFGLGIGGVAEFGLLSKSLVSARIFASPAEFSTTIVSGPLKPGPKPLARR